MTNPHPPMPTPGGSPPANTPIASEPGHAPEYGQRQDISSPWSPGPPPSAPQGHYTGGPWQPAPQQQPAPPGGKPRRAPLVTAAIVALAAVFAAGIGGVFVGSRLNTEPADQQQTEASPPAPTDAEVNAATVDLCTRFAAGSRAMPVPQNTGFDVIPTLIYISDALDDNALADPAIRDAVTSSLKLFHDQVSFLMKSDGARGAIQPVTDWTPEAANQADQRVWDLCRAYGA